MSKESKDKTMGKIYGLVDPVVDKLNKMGVNDVMFLAKLPSDVDDPNEERIAGRCQAKGLEPLEFMAVTALLTYYKCCYKAMGGKQAMRAVRDVAKEVKRRAKAQDGIKIFEIK